MIVPRLGGTAGPESLFLARGWRGRYATSHRPTSQGSRAAAANTRARYAFDQWNSRIGLALVSSAPARARLSSIAASTMNQTPHAPATSGYSQPVCATGHSTRLVATVRTA